MDAPKFLDPLRDRMSARTTSNQDKIFNPSTEYTPPKMATESKKPKFTETHLAGLKDLLTRVNKATDELRAIADPLLGAVNQANAVAEVASTSSVTSRVGDIEQQMSALRNALYQLEGEVERFRGL